MRHKISKTATRPDVVIVSRSTGTRRAADNTTLREHTRFFSQQQTLINRSYLVSQLPSVTELQTRLGQLNTIQPIHSFQAHPAQIMSMSTPMAMPPAKRQRVDTGGGDAPPVQPQPQPHPGYQYQNQYQYQYPYPYSYPYPHSHMQIQMQMPPMQAVPGMPPNGLPPINFPLMDRRLQSIISALAQPMIQSQVEKYRLRRSRKLLSRRQQQIQREFLLEP